MTAMMHDLVGTVAGEIVAAVPDTVGDVPDSAALAGRLTASRLLDREELVSLLLRRADEHRISTTFAGRSGVRQLPLLPRLVGDGDAAVAAAAMALVVARGRRRDAFGQPRIELNDLDAGEARVLAFAVAAALDDAGVADRGSLAMATNAVASAHAPADSIDAAVDTLVDALSAAGRNDDSLAEASAEDGEASLLAGLLARRAGISPDTGWGYLVGGQAGGLALLCRMAGLGRPAAARLFAEFGALSGASIEEEILSFDRLSEAEAGAALDWWRLPPDFRGACAAMAGAHG